MKKLFELLFPEYTMWKSLEVVLGMNTHYLVQMRMNKRTGLKYFKQVPIIDAHYNPKECVKLSNINAVDVEEKPIVQLMASK
jgi:hypothetical protein